MKLTDGEKLILLMLADIYKHLGIENGEFDPEFVATTIDHDHLWGFNWQYSGIPFENKDEPPELKETVDYLDMWDYLESSFARLSPEDKERVDRETRVGAVKFPGFDGNNEDHFGIARYLIDHLDRFQNFKDRALNSHSHQVERYARMFEVFEPIQRDMRGDPLSADQIIQIMNAGVHPTMR